MPYKDREKLLAYHREYRRSEKARLSHEMYIDRSIWIGGGGGRRVSITFNPRKGICSNCGKISKHRLHLHHALGYFMILPWLGIIELCTSCHDVETFTGRKPTNYLLFQRNKKGQFMATHKESDPICGHNL